MKDDAKAYPSVKTEQSIDEATPIETINSALQRADQLAFQVHLLLSSLVGGGIKAEEDAAAKNMEFPVFQHLENQAQKTLHNTQDAIDRIAMVRGVLGI